MARDLVVLDLVAKGAGHAATAAVDFLGRRGRAELQDVHYIGGAGQGFLVAVSVKQQGWRDSRRRGRAAVQQFRLLAQAAATNCSNG